MGYIDIMRYIVHIKGNKEWMNKSGIEHPKLLTEEQKFILEEILLTEM